MTRRDFGKPEFVSRFSFLVSENHPTERETRNEKRSLLHRVITSCKMGWIDHIERVSFFGSNGGFS